jgi:hypothetical protein
MQKTERTKNKRLILVAILTLVFLAIFGVCSFKLLGGAKKPTEAKPENAVLDAEYKNTDGNQIEIAKTVDENEVVPYLEKLIHSKKTFVLYVSLPICNGDAAKFKEYVLSFQKNNHLSFVYMTSDYVKDSSLYQTVKYFPSVIIYKNGEIAKYLRYDSDEDKEFYKSYDGFEKWMRENLEF